MREGGRARGEARDAGNHRPDFRALEGPSDRRDTRDGHEAGVDSDDRSGRVDPGDCSSRTGSDSHSGGVGSDNDSSRVGPDSDSSHVGPRTRQAIANHGVAVRANP